MQRRLCARGFSMLELLIALAVFIILIFAVGAALQQTLWAEVRDAGRIGASRSASVLASRLREEARSSTAVFIPTTDVKGAANGDGHEVDLFRKASAGSEVFVAYRFDATTGTITRDEYATTAGVTNVTHSDIVAEGLARFAATRQSAASMPDIVNAGHVQQVAIQYGHPQVTGGNDVIAVVLSSNVSGGLPAQTVEIHLAAKAAPTSLAIVVPVGTPPGTPPTRVVPFVILLARVGAPHPHGPFDPQDPGQTEGPNSGAFGGHPVTPAVFGTAMYYGDGTGLSWLDVVSAEPTLTDGTYVLRAPNGSNETLLISCGSVPCPRFAPLPIPSSGLAPPGSVVFQEAN